MSAQSNFDGRAALSLVAIMFTLMGVFWYIGGIGGIPFIGEAPQTIDAEEFIEFSETDETVTIHLIEELPGENEIVVNSNGDSKSLNYNQDVTFNKEDINEHIQVDSINNGNVYDSFLYDVNESDLEIIFDEEEEFLTNTDYAFNAHSTNNPQSAVVPVNWTFNGEKIDAQDATVFQSFNESGNYTITAESTIDNVNYQTEKNITIVEPDEIILNASVSNDNPEALEEIDFEVSEENNQSISSYHWYLDNNDSRIESNFSYWFQEPGKYHVNVTAESEETSAIGEETISVNVTERPTTEDTHRITVNAFDSQENNVINGAEVTLNNAVSEMTENGTASFDVVEGNYNIMINEAGYETYNTEIYVENNEIVTSYLSQEDTSEELDEENDLDEDIDEDDLEQESSSSDIDAQFHMASAEGIDAQAPTDLEFTLEEMPGNGTTDNPYEIRTVEQLQAIQVEPDASYIIKNNINALESQLWNQVTEQENEFVGTADSNVVSLHYSSIKEDTVNIEVGNNQLSNDSYEVDYTMGNIEFEESPAEQHDDILPSDRITVDYELENVYNGFEPIDAQGNTLDIDGQDYYINNLYINRPDENNIGLINSFDGGIIQNLNLQGFEITGRNNVGGLVGNTDSGIIENSMISGQISGSNSVGGFVGASENTLFNNLKSLVSVEGDEDIGGLAGKIELNSEVNKSFVQTQSGYQIGGEENVGGIVGSNLESDISNSYSRTIVYGIDSIGGIAGQQSINSNIDNVYSVDSVIEVGESNAESGGLIGTNSGNLMESYWDIMETGQTESVGSGMNGVDESTVTGLETEEMQGSENEMNSFDYDQIWSYSADYPVLKWIYDGVDEQFGDLIISSDEEADNEIELGQEVNSNPYYHNFDDSEEATISIYESDNLVEQFTLSPESSTNSEHDITDKMVLDSIQDLEGHNYEINYISPKYDIEFNITSSQGADFSTKIGAEDENGDEVFVTTSTEVSDLKPGDYTLIIEDEEGNHQTKTKQIFIDSDKEIDIQLDAIPVT